MFYNLEDTSERLIDLETQRHKELSYFFLGGGDESAPPPCDSQGTFGPVIVRVNKKKIANKKFIEKQTYQCVILL